MNMIFVQDTKKRIIKLIPSDIIYIHADMGYTNICTKKERILCSKTLTFFLEKIKNENFIQCHRSYIVNIENIECVVKDEIFVSHYLDKKYIPLSENFRKAFLEKLNILS